MNRAGVLEGEGIEEDGEEEGSWNGIILLGHSRRARILFIEENEKNDCLCMMFKVIDIYPMNTQKTKKSS